MRIDVKECAGLLKAHDNILILTHAHPDGDTLGSGFALLRALLQLGKTARVVMMMRYRKNTAISLKI